MALKDTEIRALKPREKNYRKADSGGLYLEVFSNGSKLWRWKFRVGGKEKRLALGAYPTVSLKDARAKRDEEKAKLLGGMDPALERKRGKVAAKISAANTFAAVAREYIETKMVGEARAKATVSKAHWFLEQLEPAIGTMPIAEVDQQMLLAALMRIQMRGRYETAKKCRSFASRVFRYQGIRALVAFSGTVEDPDDPGSAFTEVGMNDDLPEKELPERFGGDEYRVLIVAEKYQTGFDHLPRLRLVQAGDSPPPRPPLPRCYPWLAAGQKFRRGIPLR